MDREALERELRRLFHQAAAEPLPEAEVDDDRLAQLVQERANDEDPPNSADNLER